ncbi:lysosomal Pro-X carboxypeptidase-like [Glandiceps talaboti]
MYSQRYLVSDEYWNPVSGPIFFYTGNEGDIAWFCNNTGFMWDIAPEFKAMLVFAEHRYYGESLPYGNHSKDPGRIGYLTSEQALADFATLVRHIKSTVVGAENTPVIAFGGSYGGMLAAWFRMKYPNIVAGALAASAPIWQFPGLFDCGGSMHIVTQDFTNAGPECSKTIGKSWDVLNKMKNAAKDREWLSTTFHLCDPLKTPADVDVLSSWLSDTWFNLAMVDYPYPASFLEPLPAWPIKVVCSHMSDSSVADKELLSNIAKGVLVYYNYTGQATCLNTSQTAVSSLGDLFWGFQACTEMVMPVCSDGVHDMFPPSTWDFDTFAKNCHKSWGITPRKNWIAVQYGGKDIKAASNIVFSNGNLDPWSAGGVLESLSESLVAIVIKDGAHHLDLRASDKDDPQSVLDARKQEKEHIQSWIQQAH